MKWAGSVVQKDLKPPKPIVLLCFTILLVLLFVFFGLAALDPEFGARGRGSSLLRSVPRPAISIISSSMGALVIWAMWRPLWYRWKQRPHFMFNSFGFGGLCQKTSIASPIMFAKCRWRDVTKVDRIQLGKELFQIRVRCRINSSAPRPLVLTFAWLGKPALSQLEFLSLLSAKRPDLRAQIDSVLSAPPVTARAA
jgi:hypothetical protein